MQTKRQTGCEPDVLNQLIYKYIESAIESTENFGCPLNFIVYFTPEKRQSII